MKLDADAQSRVDRAATARANERAARYANSDRSKPTDPPRALQLPDPPMLRVGGAPERNLVFASWMRTYVDQSRGYCERCSQCRGHCEACENSCRSGIDRALLFAYEERTIRDIFARPETKVILACIPEAPTAVYGWMCWEGDVLHYLCVKPRWQRLGIATWMLSDFYAQPVTYSYRTDNGKRLRPPASWSYAPMRRFKEAA